MINLLLMLACSTEVGLMGYVDKKQDTFQPEPSPEASAEPSQEPSSEPSIEGISGYINYYLRQVACPACVGESQELLVEFKTKFYEPTSDLHTEWIPEIGTCTNQLLITVPSTNPIDIGPEVTVSGPVHSFVATRSSIGEHYAYLYETQYDRNAVHDVSLSAYDEQFTFASIEGFDYIEPWNMLFVDPSYAFDAAILRSGMTFSWGPYGSSGVFMVTIAAYNQQGNQLLGYAACVGPDQGYLTFPGAYLSVFPAGSLAVIHLARHKVTMVPYVPLNSHIETHMEWEVVGTGYLQ